VIAGHRRLEAAKLAGLETVPVNYYEGDRPRQASLIENLHREDLDPIDAARGLKAIAEEFELATNKEIAEQVQNVDPMGQRATAVAEPAEGVQRQSPQATSRWRPSACCARSPKSRLLSPSASASRPGATR